MKRKPNNKIIPFTRAHYPEGYSRKNCETELVMEVAKLENLKENMKKSRRSIARLMKELDLGGKFKYHD